MATYGRGQMLGSGINPESFKQDYSGFANAAAIRAQGLSNLGASIGGAIKMVGDERKEINQKIAKGKSALQFAKANYPELAGRIDEIGKIFSDVNVSKADQAAAGSQMGDFVTAMIRGQEFDKEIDLKERTLANETALRNREIEIKGMGKPLMTYTPKEYDAFRAAGFKGKVVGRQPNGDLIVEELTSEGAGEGGVVPFFNNGTIGFTKQPAPIFKPTPGGDDTGVDIYGNPGVLPILKSKKDTDITTAIDYANSLTRGKTDVSEVSPMVGGAEIVSGAVNKNPLVPSEKVENEYFHFNPETGQIEVTQLPGSKSELDRKIAQQELAQKEVDTALAKEEFAKSQKAINKSINQDVIKTNFIIDKANEAREIIEKDISDYGINTPIDIAKSKLAGTQAYKLQNQILPALKDSIALDQLKQLKAASPTGSSGLGSLTEKEGKRLENMYGVLDVGGDKVILLKDIKRLKETAFDYIHGSKNEREQALKKGLITKEQNDQVEQIYREQILGIKEDKKQPNLFQPSQLDAEIDSFLNQ